MPEEQNNTELLKDVINLFASKVTELTDKVSKQEFDDAIDKIFNAITPVIRENKEAVTRMEDFYRNSVERNEYERARSISELQQKVDGEFTKVHVDSMREEIESQLQVVIKNIEKRVSEIRDGKDGKNGADGSPDTPEQVRDKLKSIKENDNKLPIEAIKDLQEELKKLSKRINNISQTSGGGGGSGGGRIVKVYDLSGSLNGVTKTFSLPAFWRVLTVDLSSFPNTLRPTAGYTTDGAAMTITFTSEIDAASSLATGQTCIVTYSE